MSATLHLPEATDPWQGRRLEPAATVRVATADLLPGDYVVRGLGLPDRTVSSVTMSPYVNRSNLPILYVNYHEGSGNSAIASTLWDVIR